MFEGMCVVNFKLITIIKLTLITNIKLITKINLAAHSDPTSSIYMEYYYTKDDVITCNDLIVTNGFN